MSRSSHGPTHGTRVQRDGGGLIRRRRGCSPALGLSQGDGAGRWLRATAAMRIAATGSTIAAGPFPGLAVASRLVRND